MWSPLPVPQLLADAFSEFITASSVLEGSYRDLQEEVAHLGSELCQRNAELSRSLEENERMRAALQQMLDSMPCGVLVLDDAERIVMINPEGRSLLNLGSAYVDSLRALSQISQIDFEALAAKPAAPFDSDMCIEADSGKRWLAISHRRLASAPAFESFAERPGQLESIWILRDITANKQAEQERETARRATALAEISTLLAHEIKNPLASMELFAGLIEQDPSDASQWISHLRAGIRTLSGTVNNVLSLNGEGKPRLSPISLAACVESGVEFVKPVAEQAGVVLSFFAGEAVPPVLGNEDAIRQIILNIVCNAIRHTPTGGKVEVSAHAAKRGRARSAQVTVRDTGRGIPDSVKERIFDAGFSATGETPGLGLAVCKRLMIQHGGEIQVSSRLNEGIDFSVGVSSHMSTDEARAVMVVDDEPGIRTALRANFLRHGWQVETASCVREAVRNVEDRVFDLVVTDMRMPDGTGMEVMRAARKASPETAVILLTAYGTVPDAVSAMRDGALDYLTKPIPFDRLQITAAQVMGRARRLAGLEDTSVTGDIVGRSPLLFRALQRARAAAVAGADVLIEAESGTGKELLARYIHDSSDRCGKPFVAVNCAAVPEALLESELFGHGRGAFTGAIGARPGKFELANGGTILLDEIGEMPLNLQPKLLRVLQEREFERLGETSPVRVDIHVIATTNVSLATMVERGQFRADLYYRLNVIPLSLPPLRERREDIPILALHFAEKYAVQHGGSQPRLQPDFLDRLQAHSWPGNVRELANFMRRVITLSRNARHRRRMF